MKIHKIDDYSEAYNNLGIDMPEVASAYFRSIYQDKHINKDRDKDKKKKLSEELKIIYYSLPVSKQFVVNNLIQDLLSDSKSRGYVGVYLKAFLEDEQLTYSKLASCIDGYLAASMTIQSNLNANIKSLEEIKSSIKKLLTTVNAGINNSVLQYIADFFCVSADVLITGKGKKYSVDLERLCDLVGKANMDAEEFLNEHLELDMVETATESEKKAFEVYIHRSARVLRKLLQSNLQ